MTRIYDVRVRLPYGTLYPALQSLVSSLLTAQNAVCHHLGGLKNMKKIHQHIYGPLLTHPYMLLQCPLQPDAIFCMAMSIQHNVQERLYLTYSLGYPQT